MNKSPCYGCEKRFDRCHGRNADGSWRCFAYRNFSENNAARLAASATQIMAENDVAASKKAMRRRG